MIEAESARPNKGKLKEQRQKSDRNPGGEEMIEFPEALTIAQQMNDELNGKWIESSIYMDSPHKFAFGEHYGRKSHTPEEYENILNGKTIGQVTADGSWILVSLEPGYMLKLGEGGERILFHQSEDTLPEKHQLLLHFVDESYLTVSVQGWGLVAIYQRPKDAPRSSGKISPLSDAFTFEHFQGLFGETIDRKSIKSFMISEPGISGVGNGYLQDILFRARIHPTRKNADITEAEKRALYDAIREILKQAVELGGRDTERDLYNNRGGYPKILDRTKLGQPCPECGAPIQKIKYLGGSCYLCSSCQT